MFEARRLREQITIRRAVESDNGKGGYTTDWAEVATVAAEVIGINGRESVMDQVLQGVSVYTITIRWRDDVRQSDQLRSAGRPCFGRDAAGNPRDANIRSVDDLGGTRQWLSIVADTAAVR
jgi:SPP1 family predicted phage head-tail adaptor